MENTLMVTQMHVSSFGPVDANMSIVHFVEDYLNEVLLQCLNLCLRLE